MRLDLFVPTGRRSGIAVARRLDAPAIGGAADRARYTPAS